MKKLLIFCLTLMLLCSAFAQAELAGGWTIPESTELPDDVISALEDAVAGTSMSNLQPKLLLGTQIVAGVNDAILCADGEAWDIVYVNVDPSGYASLLQVQELIGKPDSLVGGWSSVPEDVSPEDLEAIAAVMSDVDGVCYDELIVLSRQLVAGMNYAVLSRKLTLTETPVLNWALVTVYVDFNGQATMTDVQDIQLGLIAE